MLEGGFTLIAVRTAAADLDLDELVQDTPEQFRVHGRVYTDPSIFDLELERIFHRGWVYVGHSSEIPEPGDYRLTRIGTQSVILCRDEHHEVRLLLNRCRHRANAVCQAERGNATYFRCAYHGWTYSNTGALVGVTYQNRYPAGFNKDEMGLCPVPRIGIHRGFVFGSLSDTGVSLDQHLGHAKPYLDLCSDQSPDGELSVRAGIDKTAFKANWKFQVENTLDGYHGNFTHQATIENMAAKRLGVTRFPLGNPMTGDSAGCTRDLGNGHTKLEFRELNRPHVDRKMQEMAQTPVGKTYIEGLLMSHGRERVVELLTEGAPHVCIFPNLVLIREQIRVIQPVTVDYTEVFRFPVLLKGAPLEVNTARLRAHEAFFGPASGGAPDDLEMFDRNQIGLSATVNPWLVLDRGLGRERRDEDGTVVGQFSDELPQRSIFRHWKNLLSQA
jgi:phenylpropionate dioxygenase-like ring-hydroxylating dioxygenase large terminal subunit